ncbi:MAG: hypothetical protein ACXIUQ_16525 [Cecembia sp.]
MKKNLHFPLPRDEVKSVEEAIRKIRYLQTEHLYVFKNGKQIRRFAGETSYVNIPYQYLFELKDAVVIHNHPNDSTFSLEDVQTAVDQDIMKLYVATKTHYYTIKRPQRGWGFDFFDSEVQDQLKFCQVHARQLAEKHIAQFEIKNEDRDAIILHYIWVFFFDLLNIEYAKKEYTNNPIRR